MGTHLFEDLPDVLKGYEDQLYKMVTLVVQKAALAGGTYLGEETPVDTGVARSNWVATIGAPFAGIIPAYVPYPSYRVSHHEPVKVATLRSPGTRRRLSSFRPSRFNAGSP